VRGLIVLVSALLVVASLVATGGEATPEQATKLNARVGPGFTISLTNEAGARVTRLDPGMYEIEVNDLSEEHNFRLSGPGVSRATEIGDTGTVTWTVSLTNGTYRYVCDPHAGTMNGSFTVGDVTTPSPTPPPGTVTPATKLQLTSGPGFTITLRTVRGKAVRTMKIGTYRVTVRDRSRVHNAHLVGPGYNRATKPLTSMGTQTWRVKLARAGTLRFLCDPHASQGMRGSARVVR
jgi:plastocyanin